MAVPSFHTGGMLAIRPRFVADRSKTGRSLSFLPVAALAALALITGACSGQSGPPQRQTARPAPRPVMTQQAVVPPLPAHPHALPPTATTKDWRDMAQTAGTWTWTMDGGRSTARFGLAGAAPVAMFRCDPAAQSVTLWRTMTGPIAPAGTPVTLAVNTTGTKKILTAQADGASGMQVAILPRDPLLDAIAFSRGRFMLESTNGSTLYLPSWPEISRVIEDCR